MTLSVHDRIEKQLLLVTNEESLSLYIDRLLRTCQCFKKRNGKDCVAKETAKFYLSPEDQKMIDMLLRVCLKSSSAKKYLESHLKHLLFLMCDAVLNDCPPFHDFIVRYITTLVKLKIGVDQIIRLLDALALAQRDSFHEHLFLQLTQKFIENIESDQRERHGDGLDESIVDASVLAFERLIREYIERMSGNGQESHISNSLLKNVHSGITAISSLLCCPVAWNTTNFSNDLEDASEEVLKLNICHRVECICDDLAGILFSRISSASKNAAASDIDTFVLVIVMSVSCSIVNSNYIKTAWERGLLYLDGLKYYKYDTLPRNIQTSMLSSIAQVSSAMLVLFEFAEEYWSTLSVGHAQRKSPHEAQEKRSIAIDYLSPVKALSSIFSSSMNVDESDNFIEDIKEDLNEDALYADLASSKLSNVLSRIVENIWMSKATFGDYESYAEQSSITESEAFHLLSPILRAWEMRKDGCNNHQSYSSCMPHWYQNVLPQYKINSRSESNLSSLSQEESLNLLGTPSPVLLEIMFLFVESCGIELFFLNNDFNRTTIKRVLQRNTSEIVAALEEGRTPNGHGCANIEVAGRLLMLQEVLIESAYLRENVYSSNERFKDSPCQLLNYSVEFLCSFRVNLTDILSYSPFSSPSLVYLVSSLIGKLAKYACIKSIAQDFMSSIMHAGISSFSSALRHSLALASENVSDISNCFGESSSLSKESNRLFCEHESNPMRIFHGLNLMWVWGTVLSCLVNDKPIFTISFLEKCHAHEERVLLDVLTSLIRLFVELGTEGVKHLLQSEHGCNAPGFFLNEINMSAVIFGLSFILEPIYLVMSRLSLMLRDKNSSFCLGKDCLHDIREFWSILALLKFADTTMWNRILEKFLSSIRDNYGGSIKLGEDVVGSFHPIRDLQMFNKDLPSLCAGIADNSPLLVAFNISSNISIEHSLCTGVFFQSICHLAKTTGSRKLCRGDWIDAITGWNVNKHVARNQNAFCRHLKRKGYGKSLEQSCCAKKEGFQLAISLFFIAIMQLECTRFKGFSWMLLYLRDPSVCSSPPMVELLSTLSDEIIFPLIEKRLLKCSHISDGARLSEQSVLATVIPQCLHTTPALRSMAYKIVRKCFASQACPDLLWSGQLLLTLFQCIETLDNLEHALVNDSQPDENIEMSISVELTPCVPHFGNEIPTMTFPVGCSIALAEVAKPFLTLSYEWLGTAGKLKPWALSPLLDEYILVREGSLPRSTSISIAEEMSKACIPFFHAAEAINEQSTLHTCRYIASKSVSHMLISVLSNRKNTASGSCHLSFAHVQIKNLSGESMVLPSEIIEDSGAIAVPSTVGEVIPSMTSKLKLYGEIQGIFSASSLKSIANLNEFLFGIKNSILTAMRNADHEFPSSIARNLSRATCVVRELYLNSTESDSMQYFMADFLSLMTLFEDVAVSENIGNVEVRVLLFSWRWLFAVFRMDNIKNASEMHLPNSREDVDYTLSELVIENAIHCFQLSAGANLGMFSSSGVDTHNISLISTPRHDEDLKENTGPSNPGKCIDHSPWITFLHESLLSSKSVLRKCAGTFVHSMAQVLMHPSFFSSHGMPPSSRFHLLAVCLHILVQSSHNSPVRATTGSSSQTRRIFRERIYYCGLAAFTHTKFEFPNDIKELKALKYFLRNVRIDLGTVQFEYSNEMEYSTHVWDRDSNRSENGKSLTGAFAYLRSLLHDDDSNLYNETQNLDTQSVVNNVYRVGSLLCAFLLYRIDQISAVAIPNKQLPPKKTQRSDAKFPLIGDSDTLEDAICLPNTWYEDMLLTAWQVNPQLAICFFDCFRFRLTRSFGPLTSCVRCLGCHHRNGVQPAVLESMRKLIASSPQFVRHLPQAMELALLGNIAEDAAGATQRSMYNMFQRDLCHWSTLSLPSLINIWMRVPVLYDGCILFKNATNNRSLSAKRRKERSTMSKLNTAARSHYENGQHQMKPVMQYLLRSLDKYLHDKESLKSLDFFLPQLVQLLRRDPYGALSSFFVELASQNTVLCHRLVCLLRNESLCSDASRAGDSSNESYGYCGILPGHDPLPAAAGLVMTRIEAALSAPQLKYLRQETDFFHAVTCISSQLKKVADKATHRRVIGQSLLEISFVEGLYLPTDPRRRVIAIQDDSWVPMQSAAKCPFLLAFKTVEWKDPFPEQEPQVEPREGGEKRTLSALERSKARGDKKGLFSSPKLYPNENVNEKSELITEGAEDDKSSDETSSEPSHAPKEPKQSDDMDFVEKICTVIRDSWKRRHGRSHASLDCSYPTHSPEQPAHSHDIEACIFKTHDDCRQDAIAIQVIRLLHDVYRDFGVHAFLRPYAVVPSCVGEDRTQGGIIQVIDNVKSRDRLGKDGYKSLLSVFEARYGPRWSPAFVSAQMELCRSLAGYAVVCYLLQIKDRHNGNILVDAVGHLIHIDFGFLLGISPGGNLGFENAPFKLSHEMVELLDVETCIDSGKTAKSNKTKLSSAYQHFVSLTVQAFLAARSVMDPLLVLVGSMIDSGLPCFQHRPDVLETLRSRFVPNMSDMQAATHMESLIENARDKWTTRAYDDIQKLQNNIHC